MAPGDVMNPHYGWGLKKNPHLLKEYTEKYVGKSLHHPSALLSTAKHGSAEQVVRKVLLTKAMCEIFVILANGQRCQMLLSAMQLQVMIVSIFKEEVLKMLIKKGYNKDNIRLVADDKPLDDDSAPVKKYGIKAGSTVQMTDNLERSHVPRLNKENCKLGIILPDGRRLSMMLCPGQLQSMTVSQFKEDILRVWAIHGYTEKHVTLQVEGKTLDNPSALLADCGIKAGSIVQMLLEVFIILPDGRRVSMMLCPGQLQSMTVSQFKEDILRVWAIHGYTEKHVTLQVEGKTLDNPSALLADCGIKAGSIVQMFLEVFIILPDGRRHVMPLSAKQLQEMTVSLLEEEVLKMLMMKTVVGYTKDVLKLHIDGMPLDNGFVLKIKAGKKVQAVIMVHGG
ncbi:uncharacterized protein LOC113012524 [Astatotilapia calliptera]|uniref:uncharacterized protein LOC113012524 n=1 Tax=Astatotilapia calliptera TaxID=8154 RepID=UPI000E42236B|nr:uncharacterized protein LOC113012524 [Astatotilapia calliptera]